MPVQTIRGAVEWAPAHARVLMQPIVPMAAACTGQRQRVVVGACDGAGDPSTWVGTRGSGLGTRGSLEEAGMWRRLSMAVAAAAACTGQRQPVIVAGDMGVGGRVWGRMGGRREGIVDGACVLVVGHHCRGRRWAVPCDACVTHHWWHCWQQEWQSQA